MTDAYNRPYIRPEDYPARPEAAQTAQPAPQPPYPPQQAPYPAPQPPYPPQQPPYPAPAPQPYQPQPYEAAPAAQPHYEEPHKEYGKYDDQFLLREINRLKTETNDIRKVLEERNVQIDKLQSAIVTGMKSDELLKELSGKFNSLSDQLEEMEDALSTQVEKNRPGKDSMKLVSDELTTKIESMRVDVEAASDKMNAAKESVDGLNEALESKAEKKSLTVLHQRVSTLFAMSAINIVGTLMTLGLLCYLIFSIAR